MMKKNKLYTVNRFNKPLFMPKENLFAGPQPGTSQMNARDIGRLGVNPSDFWGINSSITKPYNQIVGQQYLNNFAGKAAISNPFSFKQAFSSAGLKAGLKAGAGAAISAGAGLIGGLAGDAIGGGLQSGAGSAISGIGSTVGGAIGTVNPILGAAVSVGSSLLGGLTNRMFGSKINEENVALVRQKAAELNKQGNIAAGSQTNADVLSNWGNADLGFGFTKKFIGEDGWFSSAASEKYEEMKRLHEAAKRSAIHGLSTGIQNADTNMDNDVLASYHAFGGPLDNNVGAIGYDLMTDYLTTKRKNSNNKNQMTNLFMGTPKTFFDEGGYMTPDEEDAAVDRAFTTKAVWNTDLPFAMKADAVMGKDSFNEIYKGVFNSPLFAFGGDLQTHGADFGTGLTHVNAGKSHEENPYDGVQMGVDSEGTPNLVEEGEVIYNDYVYSQRITLDDEAKKKFKFPKKKDITYADAAKKLEKEIAERPNDPISQAGFEAQMQTLADAQERQKAEMEAQRAKEAFEALSPEEQTALMQQAAQQEAMAQEAAAQQPTPEEVAMAEQQAMQADGTEANLGTEPPMMAEGGYLYAEGSKIRRGVYKALGFHTDKEFLDWARKHKLRGDDKWEMDKDGLKNLAEDDEAWQALISDPTFAEAVKDNPALVHALANKYDFGAFTPDNTGNVTFRDISRGNWIAQDYEGWKGSQDPAWLEAVEKGLVKEGMKQEDIAKVLRQTDAYKRGSKWLQNSEDNRLRYLRTILEDENSPEVAKNYARKFIDTNGWKKDAARDYESIFGANGKGVRETHPGTYWHTPVEAVRGAQAQNWVINDDGSVEEIIGEVPTDWTATGNYSWATPENDMTYNYYRRPSSAASVSPETPATKTPEEEELDIEPVRKSDWMRYAGLFGPAVGLGIMAAGVGRPDYSKLDAAVDGAGNVHLADYKPLGDYLTYRPMDIWYEQNRMDAQARATDRALANSSSPSKMAGLLANGYNSQLASGELYRKALEYNDALREKTATFNRGTNQFNAEAYNRNSQFNADAQNRANQYRAGLAMQAASERLNRDAGWYNSLYGNVSGLFKGISDLGRENRETNWRNALVTSGALGVVDPEQLVRAGIAKKKGKKGLTV